MTLIPVLIIVLVIGFAIGKHYRLFPVYEPYLQQLMDEYRERHLPDEVGIHVDSYASGNDRFIISHELKDEAHEKEITFMKETKEELENIKGTLVGNTKTKLINTIDDAELKEKVELHYDSFSFEDWNSFADHLDNYGKVHTATCKATTETEASLNGHLPENDMVSSSEDVEDKK